MQCVVITYQIMTGNACTGACTKQKEIVRIITAVKFVLYNLCENKTITTKYKNKNCFS